MRSRRNPSALVRFALRDGDLPLARLLVGALARGGGRGSNEPRLVCSGLAPSPLVERTLRASLELLGLPPAPG